MFFRDNDYGLSALGMKYRRPANQIDIGVPSPVINVVRKL